MSSHAAELTVASVSVCRAHHRNRRRLDRLRTPPLSRATYAPEEERNEEDADRGGEQHSGEHASADRMAARRPRARREHQWQHAENECNPRRRHGDDADLCRRRRGRCLGGGAPFAVDGGESRNGEQDRRAQPRKRSEHAKAGGRQ